MRCDAQRRPILVLASKSHALFRLRSGESQSEFSDGAAFAIHLLLNRFDRIVAVSLEAIAFAAAAAMVTGAAYDVVQEAFAVAEFSRKDVVFRNL